MSIYLPLNHVLNIKNKSWCLCNFSAPEQVSVEVEGQPWELSEVRWHSRGMLIGGNNGGVALLTPTKPYVVKTALFVYKYVFSTFFNSNTTKWLYFT